MRNVWVATLAIGVLILHASVLGSWIVDDAGISFSYARNLASGHGLVAQPGVAPVEGFTNLLWVLLLAPTMASGFFDPVVTPKLLAAVATFSAFVAVSGLVSAGGHRPPWVALAALVTTALVPGFAIWCASGLENALLVLTTALLATVCARAPKTESDRIRRSLLAGLSVVLVSLTRPDGILYFWILPLLLGVESGMTGGPLRVYLSACAIPWLALTAWRAVYFGDIAPNAFYAKEAEGVKVAAWLLDVMPLPAATGLFMVVGAVALVGIGAGCVRAGRWLGRRCGAETARRNSAVLFLFTAYVVYAVLRGDWMGEYRFLTPAFLFGPAAVLGLVHDGAQHRQRTQRLTAGVALMAVGVVGVAAWRRTADFAAHPTVSLAQVRERSRALAARLAPLGPRAIVLTPDIGGALWEDRFRVMDPVGLIDRDIGRPALHRDKPALRRYVLLERRPDAIWLHSIWYEHLGLVGDAYADFTALYRPLEEFRPTPQASPEWGLYVRDDLAGILGARESP